MSEELDVSMKCVQYMLFVSNFLFVMVSLLLISIGTIIKAMYNEFEYFLESTYFSPSDLIIISGFIVFFVAFFGCWGAVKESTVLVNTYALLLTIILILEITAALIALFMRFNLSNTITDNMDRVFARANESDVQDVFDFTQSQLQCCGVHNASDWSKFYEHEDLPQSCCPGFEGHTNITTCKLNRIFRTDYYRRPCATEVSNLVSETAYLLTTCAACVAFIEIVGIIFARVLSKTIRTLKTQRLVEAETRRQQIYSQIILGASLNGEIVDNKPHNTSASEA